MNLFLKEKISCYLFFFQNIRYITRNRSYSLFKQYPEYQKQFKLFKDVPIDELPKNKRFQAHCVNIISAISKLIEQMCDPELMQATLINLIEKHKNRGQTQEQFEVSEDSSCFP